MLVEDTYKLKSMCPKSVNIVFLLLKNASSVLNIC